MISILIPIFNYKIVDLVTNLHEQLESINIPFEIICLDDGSDENYINNNKSIKQLKNVFYEIADKNKGRTQTRQDLANKAKYDWLLFLDADIIPKSETFIKNYLQYINKEYDVIFGGFAYYDKTPSKEYILRWKYGRTKEQQAASIRNKKPYKIIISANFLIKKELFLTINPEIKQNIYGLDNIFGANLKDKNAKVLHIDNEVYHLGIETNTSYLRKKEESALAVLDHYKAKKISKHQNDLLNLFIKSKRYGLNHIFSLIYLVWGNPLKKHLKGNHPSIKLLQLYRISFMCYKDLYSK